MVRSAFSRHAALLAIVLLAAGCFAGGPGSTTPAEPTVSPTPADAASAATPATVTASPTTPSTPTASSPPGTDAPSPDATSSPPGRSVEYLVRAGSVPGEFGSVTVTLRVVFVDRAADLGPCYPDAFTGPYKPTITPLPTPAGECHRSEPVTVDLARSDGGRSLGRFTAPDSTAGHALVVTDVDATRRNGTAVTAIRGIGGAEALAAAERPAGPYGVELGVTPARHDAAYDYWLTSEQFDPSG